MCYDSVRSIWYPPRDVLSKRNQRFILLDLEKRSQRRHRRAIRQSAQDRVPVRTLTLTFNRDVAIGLPARAAVPGFPRGYPWEDSPKRSQGLWQTSEMGGKNSICKKARLHGAQAPELLPKFSTLSGSLQQPRYTNMWPNASELLEFVDC